MSETAVVIGATGFIGSALVAELATRGYSVRGISRSQGGDELVRFRGGTPVRADVMVARSLRRALDGCDLVFHAGGMNTLCALDPARLYEVNVRGSVNVMEAAAAGGVRRVIYTSSAATVGEAAGTVATEVSPHRGWFLSDYERSKFLAERRVLELGRELGVEVMCLNPSSVQGPGRTRGTARFLLRYAQGRLRWLVDTRVSILDIQDCVAAHVLAATSGRVGARHLLNGATVPVSELMELAAAVTGRRTRVRMVPPWAAVAAGSLVEVGARLVRRRPPVCREMVRTLLHGHAYDGSRAAAELGFAYTPLPEFVRRTFSWYREQGLID